MNLIIILFGVLGYTFLGVREFPSIDPPIVSVRTTYTGADAEVIESQITEPLEKEINSIEGIKNISSASNQGSSSITIEFNLNRDLERSEEHKSELQSLMRLSYAVFCLKKKQK